MSKIGKCCKDCRFFHDVSDGCFDECVEGIIHDGDDYGFDVNANDPACSKFKEWKNEDSES